MSCVSCMTNCMPFWMQVMCLGVRRCPVLILNVYISCNTADLMGILNVHAHLKNQNYPNSCSICSLEVLTFNNSVSQIIAPQIQKFEFYVIGFCGFRIPNFQNHATERIANSRIHTLSDF